MQLTQEILLSPGAPSQRPTAEHPSSLCAIFGFPILTEAAVGNCAWDGLEEATVENESFQWICELYHDKQSNDSGQEKTEFCHGCLEFSTLIMIEQVKGTTVRVPPISLEFNPISSCLISLFPLFFIYFLCHILGSRSLH